MGLSQAQVRQRNATAGYAGEVTALEAWELLGREPDAMLIDVRTPPEWAFAGEPDLGALGKNPIRIPWKLFPSNMVNPQFVDLLREAGVKPGASLLFLCRSGGRSLDAACAATVEGFVRCYNVTDGFEGELNEHRQRGMLTGWKASGLPWIQS